mmetsp:Transcript_135828/g.434543  ORF Transcript_135828/g.434543 Transcript_135828/m.434543 type:complete len:217 (-) Transcript_135828:59-709(-)
MRAPAAVGVDDDFPASQTGVALRPADDELPRGVDVHVRVAAVEREGAAAVLQLDLLQRLLHHEFRDLPVHLFHARGRGVRPLVARALLGALGLQRLRVLRGDDHGVDLAGLHGAVGMLDVLDGHLGLAVGAQPPERAVLAHVRELLAQTRGHGVRQRHAVLSLVAGVSEHDALVAGADVEVLLADVHSTGDVGALLVDAHEDLAGLVAQALAVHAG